MADIKRCTYCFSTTFKHGICAQCHRQPTNLKEASASALPPGYILHEQYYIGEVLGQGGFGITYTAWDLKNHRRVAVKELFPSKDVTRDPDHHGVSVREGQEAYFAQVSHCFEQEAMMLMRLQNQEGIIHLYHAFNDNQTIYYVMEFLEGVDLRKYLAAKGTMTWDVLAPILRILLQGLQKLHKEGLIHRDISPDNIFLTSDGNVRLIDFGSVRAYQGADHFTTFVKQNFAPWEQFLSNGKQGPWTDIYALSVTIYYALSGKLPPNASERRMMDEAIPLELLCPTLPKHVASAVMHGMAVLPEKRCQNVREFYHLLFPNEGGQHTTHGAASLTCVNGQYKGYQWHLMPGTSYRIGRNQDNEIHYPPDTHGISRIQCTIFVGEDGKVWVRDEKSRYGTYLISTHKKVRMAPMQWYYAHGCWLCFGNQEQYLIQ